MKTFVIIFTTLITIICVTIIFSLMGESKSPFGHEPSQSAVVQVQKGEQKTEESTGTQTPPKTTPEPEPEPIPTPVTPDPPPKGIPPLPSNPPTISDVMTPDSVHEGIGRDKREKAQRLLQQILQ